MPPRYARPGPALKPNSVPAQNFRLPEKHRFRDPTQDEPMVSHTPKAVVIDIVTEADEQTPGFADSPATSVVRHRSTFDPRPPGAGHRFTGDAAAHHTRRRHDRRRAGIGHVLDPHRAARVSKMSSSTKPHAARCWTSTDHSCADHRAMERALSTSHRRRRKPQPIHLYQQLGFIARQSTTYRVNP